MDIKSFSVGDKVLLKTREREFEGILLESYDPEIVLIKLENGYNIGIREREIIDAKIVEKKEVISTKREVKIGFNESLPSIGLIITGGTISSRLDPKTGGVISTDVEEILCMAPEISKVCNIKRIENPFMKFSEDMSYKDWKTLSKAVCDMLNDKNIRGIIVTHGTDSLHFTSSALSFFLKKLNKPVAITYSQRSIDRASTDASFNLYCAAKYAVSDIAEICIVGHESESDDYCLAILGTRARKMHTSKRDTFKSINDGPVARIGYDSFEILRTFNSYNPDLKVSLDDKFFEKVAIVKAYPNSNPSILDFYKEQGYKGIIIEVMGLGQVPGRDSLYNWLPKIKKVIDEGVVVCATAQTIYGRLNPNVYSTGRELAKTGIIFLGDMLSETAYVKLGWILGHTTWARDYDKIKELMRESICGEISVDLER